MPDRFYLYFCILSHLSRWGRMLAYQMKFAPTWACPKELDISQPI